MTEHWCDLLQDKEEVVFKHIVPDIMDTIGDINRALSLLHETVKDKIDLLYAHDMFEHPHDNIEIIHVTNDMYDATVHAYDRDLKKIVDLKIPLVLFYMNDEDCNQYIKATKDSMEVVHPEGSLRNLMLESVGKAVYSKDKSIKKFTDDILSLKNVAYLSCAIGFIMFCDKINKYVSKKSK